MNSDEEKSTVDLFSKLDLGIFILILALSALIGLYYGFVSKKKQNTTKEYLLGGKTMSIWPISFSLIASHISGISLLGTPAEMYMYGTQYAVCFTCCLAVIVTMWWIFLPVFHDLQTTSCFLYLEKRFDWRVRKTASLFYAVSIILMMPIVTYAPGLAFSQVTGINLHLITPITCLVCMFYTTFGGLRAVVWTDALQFVLMAGGTATVIYLGLNVTGGLGQVWETADRGGRLIFFNMDPNPFIRSSFWTVAIGLSTMWISLTGVNPSSVQRFLAVSDLKKAKQTLLVFSAGQMMIKVFCVLVGLIIYTRYEHCDPFTSGKIRKMDQILPYFVMDVAGKIPGLPGLFIAGIFSAALSSLSSFWNTLAGTIYEDFIRDHLPTASEQRASNIMKFIVIILGIVTMSLVFIVEKMGTVFWFTITIQGLTSGTMLGLFAFGMLCRTGNTKGVISGAVVATIFLAIISLGGSGNKHSGLPLNTDGCAGNSTVTINSMNTVNSTTASDTFLLFRLSNMYYSFLGVCTCFIVAYLVSVCTGGYKVKDERLFAPFRRRKDTSHELKVMMRNSEYLHIDAANKVVVVEREKTSGEL